MKDNMKKIIVLGFAFVLSVCCALSVSAESTAAVSADFSKAGAFVAMGDMNCDNAFDSVDLIALKKMLLQSDIQGNKYADANEDTQVDIKDLVRLKKNVASSVVPVAVANNALTLNGKAYFTGACVSLLKANTEYEISYNVTSANGISLTLKGATVTAANYNSGTASGEKKFSHILKTGNSLSANNGLELAISGTGTVKNFVITEITDGWTDGDHSEQGNNDIF